MKKLLGLIFALFLLCSAAVPQKSLPVLLFLMPNMVLPSPYRKNSQQ